MGKNSYYEQYSSIVANAKLADSCVKSNPYTSLEEKVESALQQIKSIDFSSWKDANGAAFQSVVENIIKKVSTISMVINTCMSKSDQLFQQLQSKLNELKEADEKYSNTYDAKPKKENYTSYDKDKKQHLLDSDAYNSAKEKWNINLMNTSNYCKMLCEEVDKCLLGLEQVNKCEINETSIKHINKMTLPTDTIIYKYKDYGFSQYESFLINELFNKIDFSLFGYDQEAILKCLYDEGCWEKVGEMIYYTSSNFNDFISKADMNGYSYDELLATRGLDLFANSSGGERSPYVFDNDPNNVYYSHMVDINGNTFEFNVVSPQETKNNPLDFASLFINEVNGINQLSHYPSQQLEYLAITDAEQEKAYWSSAKPWTSYTYATGINIGGGFYPGKRDIIINCNCPFDYNINTINHESGHKIDSIIGEEVENVGDDISKTDKWRNLVYNNINAIERILSPTFTNDGNINDDSHISECMAEVNKYYARFPDEFQIVAPELYAEYNAMVNASNEGRDVTHPITTNGQQVSPDSDKDHTLFVGGYR